MNRVVFLSMKTEFNSGQQVNVERLDDIPLLISLQQRLGLEELIDEVIPRHWHHEGLSVGQLVVGWNAYILSQADHRKVAVLTGQSSINRFCPNYSVALYAEPISPMTDSVKC